MVFENWGNLNEMVRLNVVEARARETREREVVCSSVVCFETTATRSRPRASDESLAQRGMREPVKLREEPSGPSKLLAGMKRGVDHPARKYVVLKSPVNEKGKQTSQFTCTVCNGTFSVSGNWRITCHFMGGNFSTKAGIMSCENRLQKDGNWNEETEQKLLAIREELKVYVADYEHKAQNKKAKEGAQANIVKEAEALLAPPNDVLARETKQKAHQMMAKFFKENGIPFHAAAGESYKDLSKHFRAAGAGHLLPTEAQLNVSILDASQASFEESRLYELLTECENYVCDTDTTLVKETDKSKVEATVQDGVIQELKFTRKSL